MEDINDPQQKTESESNTFPSPVKDSGDKKTAKRFGKYFLLLLLLVVLFAAFVYFYISAKIRNAKLVASTASTTQQTTATLPVKSLEDGNSAGSLASNLVNVGQPKEASINTSLVDSLSNRIASLTLQLNAMHQALADKERSLGSAYAPEAKAYLSAIYRLTSALSTEKPFLVDLDDFKTFRQAHLYVESTDRLQDFADQGVLTSYTLAYQFDRLIPVLKRYIYRQHSKLKYYLSYVLVLRKTQNINEETSTLDATLVKVENLLLANRAGLALTVVNNNHLCVPGVTAKWCENLKSRVVADKFVSSLQSDMIYSSLVSSGKKHEKVPQKNHK